MMHTIHWLETPASIPLLDWTGPQFLAFYVTALIVLVLWCRRGARRSLNRYDNPRENATLSDPYDIAYLSGGGGRVLQLAVARLIQQRLASWKAGFFGARLIAATDTVPVHCPAPEKELLDRLIRVREKGIPVREAGRWVYPSLRAIEVRLASLGLRPTGEERGGSRVLSVMPLIGLGLLGLVKVFVGIGRDKPVWILVFLLLATLVAIAVIVSSVPRLTPSGELLLEKLRLRNQAGLQGAGAAGWDDLVMFSQAVALFGPTAVAAHPAFTAIHGDLEKLHAQAANRSAAGCGGASGCSGASGCGGGGGSGCGGGGCGGCGGGD
jgi:uncharacterized protein (TIGR04222 family)